jgi:hypothetical protein
LALGYGFIDELKGEGTTPTGFSYGPGLRMQLGERSGVTAKLPFWTSQNGQSDTLLMPSLYYFYSF